MNPKVSVVIATYNNAGFVADALGSVTRQAGPDVEIIVVNDGSTDATPSIVARAAAQDPRIRLLTPPHGGKPGIARNLGIRVARGRYLSLLDGDDVYHDDRLASTTDVLDRFPDIGVVFHDYQHVDENGAIIVPSWLESAGSRKAILDHSRPRAPRLFVCDRKELLTFMLTVRAILMTNTVLVRREALHAAGDFPEDVTIGEDADLWFRLVKDNTVAYLDSVLSSYRKHPLSLTQSTHQLRQLLDLVEVRQRGYHRVAPALDRPQQIACATRIAEDLFHLGYEYSVRGHPRLAQRFYLAAARWGVGSRRHLIRRSAIAIIKAYARATRLRRPRTAPGNPPPETRGKASRYLLL